MRFFLGTHHPAWLGTVDVPLFVSARRLVGRRTMPTRPDGAVWALDSGGFTEISTFGEWRTPPADYATLVRRCADEVGGLEWAAPQDWMCEPHILAKTGLTVAEHQRRTVDSVVDLRTRDAGLAFIPVLQGWAPDDYLRHVDLYEQAGVALVDEPVVGLGSVCRRADAADIARLVARLHREGLRLHGFGVKVDGLRRVGWALTSADSMAWSYAARRDQARQPGCEHRAKNCANCLPWALRWRDQLLRAATTERPLTLFDEEAA